MFLFIFFVNVIKISEVSMSLFNILSNSSLGSTLGSLAGQAKNTAADLGKNAPGGLGGLLGAGALGALLGTVLSKDMLKNAALVGAGAVAWNFYKKWSNKTAEAAPASQNMTAAGQNVAAAAPQAQQAIPVTQADPTAMLLLRAMIFAARADGHIDAVEQERIGKVVRQMFQGQDASSLLNGLMNEPLNPAALAAQVTSAEQGEDVYRLSCLIVDIDHFMERSYLDGLAQALSIPARRKGELEQEAAQAKNQLSLMS